MNEDTIVFEYSGWCRTPVAKINFQYTGEDETSPQIISGVEYLKLSEDKKASYIVENIIDVMRDSEDSEWADIQVVVE